MAFRLISGRDEASTSAGAGEASAGSAPGDADVGFLLTALDLGRAVLVLAVAAPPGPSTDARFRW